MSHYIVYYIIINIWNQGLMEIDVGWYHECKIYILPIVFCVYKHSYFYIFSILCIFIPSSTSTSQLSLFYLCFFTLHSLLLPFNYLFTTLRFHSLFSTSASQFSCPYRYLSVRLHSYCLTSLKRKSWRKEWNIKK